MLAAHLKRIANGQIGDEAFSLQLFPPTPAHPPRQDGQTLAQKGDRVLHLGAGTGLGTLAMGHRVGPTGEVFGVEPDWTLYARARENLLLAGHERVQLHHGPLDRIPRADGSFDLVLCNAIWMDCAEPLVVLAEMARLLRVGGRLAMREWITTGASQSPLSLKSVPTAAELRAHLSAAGFVDIHIQLDGAGTNGVADPGLTAVTVDAGLR
jgi:predicted O-methyltransferase YrrM